MPLPERWKQRPARYNASISRYCKDRISVILVRPKMGPRLLIISSPWGPAVVNTALDEDSPDLEAHRRLYLEAHPVPPPEPARGLSVYERLRRPEI